MKNRISLLSLILGICFFTSCSSDDNLTQIKRLNGTWELISYKNLVTGEITTKPVDLDFNVILKFDDTSNPNKVTSNQFLGEYTYNSFSSFKLNSYYLTEIYEPEWGASIYEIVQKDEILEYTIKNSELKIYYNNGNNVITLEKFIE
ncbi:hypothetical protein ATO12_14535 [Aquimarina atlantica]|uniref:Lipocalin-like domain-containing protein n=1 Tax=Aquimarina atlantica TaxID=1317122 RepID=A0A023BVZ0_9FLAO|nr:hypothetical protein [Aquimarina atlantica]EZH74089.1 hypothetical protein ATO12_14535 [Aquimarina atlantica]